VRMPYTPPTQRSPVASQSNTPRSGSVSSQTSTESQPPPPPGNASASSRSRSGNSKSYIHRHRRIPSTSTSTTSLVAQSSTPKSPPRETARSEEEGDRTRSLSANEGPRTATPGKIHASAIPAASPSGSPQSSSEDEFGGRRGRARDMDGSLAELHAAIQTIEQRRESSPAPPEQEETARTTSRTGEGSADSAGKVNGAQSELPSPNTPLSASARKISHSRSSTECIAFLDFPRNKSDPPGRRASDAGMDESEDEDLPAKPCLIRKKSGELVRPALRASSTGRRPSSMPGTPTYSKAVHFQDHSLEHVRHFLQVDRPMAVSAGSSPVESYDDDLEYPFTVTERSRPKSPPFEWEIRLTNFPRDTVDRAAWPVRTEKVYLSPDTRVLMGTVAVRNLAFHKLVVVRFTLDYWKTTSEVVAEYENDVRRKQTTDGYDRFTFTIKLDDQANLEKRTMFFCVRYNVAGREYWDNNHFTNYQIDFSKKFTSHTGNHHALPSPPPRQHNPLARGPVSQPRPRSMPSLDDLFSHQPPFDFSSLSPLSDATGGDAPARLRAKPSRDILPDGPTKSRPTSNQQAFGNRYDFGASLSAAIQAAGASMPRGPARTTESGPGPKTPPAVHPGSQDGHASHPSESGRPSAPDGPKLAALTTGKPGLQSPSYHELLDRYCFVRSRPAVGHQEHTEL
ncbi:MAG: hypothetical protein Q9163_006471, partial [Psora crenata]